MLTLCNISGTPIGHLGSDVRKKLKAAYTLIEQLYAGAQRIICIASHNNPAPTLIQDTLKRLSMLPTRVEELKKKESQVADLQENLKSQQAETSKAKEELTSALSAMEQLKEGFKKKRADWATEKSALTKQA